MTDHALGKLYVVATPIGNLGDMVPRAVEILQMVDVIAAEDTRHSAKLLQHFGISKAMIAYHDHSDEQRLQQLLDHLMSGRSVALISDAGTPLISDPGYPLVNIARDHNIDVSPIPGACALVAALSVSGLPANQFVFEGFLPAKQLARKNTLAALCDERRTLVFYESPHRIVESLEDMLAVFGADRYIVVARELTKAYETVLRGPLSEVIGRVCEDSNQQRGEFVLLVHGCDEDVAALGVTQEVQKLMRVLLEDLPIKQAAAIAAKATGLKKRDLYQWALSLKGEV